MSPAPAPAAPDGAEWAAADAAEGCGSCHLAAPVNDNPAGLMLEGLPESPAAGQRYPLTIVLEDPDLANAGFMLALRGDGAVGRLTAADGRVETDGARARSTGAGASPTAPGKARWQLVWTAPEALAGPIGFDIWANAGNDDLSPLGDKLYHGSWQLDGSP